MAVDWFATDFGHGRVHYGTTLDDRHDAAEAAAEAGRG